MKRSAPETNDDHILAENIKIIVIGDSSVGKSSYVNYINHINEIVNYKFQKEHDPTIDFDINFIKLKTNKGSIIIDFWDTAGQETRGNLRKAYIKGADGVLVFYDMTEKKTIDNVPNWLKQIQQLAPNAPVAVIGNKADKFADIKLSEGVKIRECNLQRDIGHNQIKNFLISIKNNTHIEFNTTGWISSTLTIEEKQGCLTGLEYVLSTICKTNIIIN